MTKTQFKKKFVFETTCVNSTAEAIGAMVEQSKSVVYRTMVKHCHGLTDWWAQGMGYFTNKRQGLTLKDDWAVSFYKSRYKGAPCYYVQHSRIEHIWVKQS